MIGQDDMATELWKKIPSLASQQAREKFAVAKSQRCLKHRNSKLLAFELMYLRRDLANLSLKQLQPMLDLVWNTETSGEDSNTGVFLLLKGTILAHMQHTEEAKNNFEELLGLEFSFPLVLDSYIFPYAHYELAEIYFHAGQLQKCEEHLKFASKHTHYDLEEVLDNRIRLAHIGLSRAVHKRELTCNSSYKLLSNNFLEKPVL